MITDKNYYDVLATMPPLTHSPKGSDVLRWIADNSQCDLAKAERRKISAARNGVIVFDSAEGVWKGNRDWQPPERKNKDIETPPKIESDEYVQEDTDYPETKELLNSTFAYVDYLEEKNLVLLSIRTSGIDFSDSIDLSSQRDLARIKGILPRISEGKDNNGSEVLDFNRLKGKRMKIRISVDYIE